ncbi:MAG: hypothetical protein ABJE95_09180 [Byssovorax sp.]
MSLRITHLAGALSLLTLAACGGRILTDEGSSVDCPPGFVCTPVCPPGFICTPDSGGSTSSNGQPTGAGGSWSSGGPSAVTSTGATGGPGPDGGVLPKSSTMTTLDYRVVDAELSVALSSLVIVSDSPSNALHIVDVTTGMDRVVALPAAPVAVTIDSTGLKAAVAYDAHVSWIDLPAGSLTKTCDISSNAFDVALSSTGTAYVMPRTDQWISLHVIEPAGCVETLSNENLRAASHIALHPGEKALFAADQGLSPSRIDRCDLTTSPPDCDDSEGQADWGTYSYCGNLWISADGARIYSACGVTLKVPGNAATGLCSYGGTLTGVSSIQHLSEAPQAQKVVMIQDLSYDCEFNGPDCDPTADTYVRVHETNFLGFETQYKLPDFAFPGGISVVAHGRFVFTTPTMDRLIAIVQADPKGGALHDFAIDVLVP